MKPLVLFVDHRRRQKVDFNAIAYHKIVNNTCIIYKNLIFHILEHKAVFNFVEKYNNFVLC